MDKVASVHGWHEAALVIMTNWPSSSRAQR